ncbi:MAG: endonuclease III [Deltaproteobacteria bacterium RIFCSPHIGHO2_12_FULL_43_9]|nr:MAG: endonuclease III [Deltaproteobacteria bacterium RIFCSPHIGHO2_12_FULL_43_9]
MTKAKANKILNILNKEFHDAKPALKAKSTFQFLIAVILSAQCTDKRVNATTPLLFKKWPDAGSLALAKVGDVEGVIRPLGFFRSKTRSIIGCSKGLVERFGGRVPGNRDDLESLPGVGRKTASVVLGNIFGVPALAVDTHVKRVSKRIGFTNFTDVVKIEDDLCRVIPKAKWALATNLLILHGRKTCKAPRPLCPQCHIKGLCNYYSIHFKS